MAEKKVPMRQCTGCRQLKGKKEMIRVLKTADTGEILIDPTGRKNGRGAYICMNSECLEAAVKNHGLERSFKCSISPEVYERLREEMKSIGQ